MKKILFLLLSVCFSHLAISQVPSLDYTYNSGNAVANLSGNTGSAIARYGSNIIVAGSGGGTSSSVIIRFLNQDGTINTTMGTSGSTTVTVNGTSAVVTDMTVNNSNGIIYISGYCVIASVNEGFVISLNPDGTINTGFSLDGEAYITLSGSQTFRAIALQSNGRVVVAGDSVNKYMAVRYLPDGQLDNSFSAGGIAVIGTGHVPFGGVATKMDISPTDEIYLAGESGLGGNYLVKLRTNGTPEYSFSILSSYYNNACVKFYNGNIIVAGTYPFGTSTVRISSYNSAGTSLWQAAPSTGFSDYLTDLHIDPQGRILASGYTHTGNYNESSLLRLSPDGTLDSQFGYSIVGYPYNVGRWNASILSSDGRLIMVGDNSGAAPANVIKVNLKNVHYHSSYLPDDHAKYSDSDPYYLKKYDNEDYKVSYFSSNPSKANVTGNFLNFRDSGTVVIRAVIPGDSAYYPFVTEETLDIEFKAPAAVIGDKTVPKGELVIESYSIKPDNLGGYWDLTEFDSDGPQNVGFFSPIGQIDYSAPSIDLFFTKDFKGGTLRYSYYDFNENYTVIERTILPSTSTTNNTGLDSLYCPQEFASCAGNYIDNFRINTLSNDSSGCSMGGYNDFTNSGITTTLDLGSVYTAGARISSNTNVSRYVGLWLDYNNDGSFTGADEFLGVAFTNETDVKISNIVLKNNDEYAGPRRLRVRCRANTPFSPTESCQTDGEEGETEDYLVTLREQEALRGPNVITPNNDGKNDFLVIKGINPKKSNNLVVVDRMGSLKYSKEDYLNDWDGKDSNGEVLSKGTYYYIFTNGDNTLKGFFEVLY